MIRQKMMIKLWLICCIILVVAMIALGGYTRLSGSGLSITQWKPIHGVIPPLNEQEWQEEFARYREIPQYKAINSHMNLAEFKEIFWPEYFHRLLGRIIGAVFLLPLLAFTALGMISRAMALKMLGIFSLGGLQGALGWYMVSSGLSENIHVSHFRLSAHFALALLLLALLLLMFLSITAGNSNDNSDHNADIKIKSATESAIESANESVTEFSGKIPLYSFISWFLILLLQLFYGALTAGLKAGLLYNTWPDMNGSFFPEDVAAKIVSAAISSAIFNDHAIVQFIHRWLAALVMIGFYLWWFFNREYVKKAEMVKLAAAIAIVIAAQFIIGILTLINAAPLGLAMLHQMNAVLLFALSVIMLRKIVVKNNVKK